LARTLLALALAARLRAAAGWATTLDFDAYLERIALRADYSLTWQTIHWAHATSIPFENLDSHRGIPVSLAQQDLERELVIKDAAGTALSTTCRSPRRSSTSDCRSIRCSRAFAPAICTRGAHHRARRAAGDRQRRQGRHADVGFGLGTLLDPIPFGPDPVYEQSGWSFRVIEDGRKPVLANPRPERLVGRSRVPAASGCADRHRRDQPVDLRQPALAVRVRADRLGQPRRRPARGLWDWSGPLQVIAMAPDGVK
jgi:hypothetical protein